MSRDLVPGQGLCGQGSQIFQGAVEEVLAQVEEARPEVGRIGAERIRAAVARPSSARTSTASSRYAWATRTGDAWTPARLSTGCHSTSSARPGSPYHDRP